MAYATISQSDDLTLNRSPSLALPELPHTSLSQAFDELTIALYANNHDPTTGPSSKVGGIIKSLTSSSRHSYDLVEEDEYDAPQETPTVNKAMADLMQGDTSHISGEDVPVRTASVSRHTPLNHPTPDLQSLQGAYLKNVERLEDSAERLSMASSLEHELGRMKEDIRRSESLRRSTSKSDRRYSGTSISNSIIGVNATARSGGYSPAAFIGSPSGSVKSNHRTSSKRQSRLSKSLQFSQPLREPEQEGKPLDSPMATSPPSQHAFGSPEQSMDNAALEGEEGAEDENRPGTSASNDTYHQAQNLFNDFDGTHFSPVREVRESRRFSVNPLTADSRSSKQSRPSEDMIYYPAPVPVMLNLPSRLSRGDWGQRDKKRMQALKAIEGENRKSTATWIADADSEPERQPSSMQLPMQLPPHLRASAFFDKPGVQQDVQLKNGSAVATLDSILDAAAFAPVSAFTDHPIAGHLGDEVYGSTVRKSTQSAREKKGKRRNSLGNILGRKGTEEENIDNHDEHEDEAEKSIKPGEDELEDGAQDDEEAEDDSDDEKSHHLGFLGAPTTLLAELQLRKEQQKSRNRTAADAFPGGMHSTLLELDAVAQLQQKSRKQKHVTLAWEDHDAADQQNFDDEDVPLGVLFPEKEQRSQVNLNRPLGLMEKKEFEENEPLSSRRARLLGVGPSQMSLHTTSPPVEEPAPTLNVPIMQDEEQLEDDEEETLAQRIQRMKKKENRASFADDVKSSLGLEVENPTPSKTPEIEETLGQRRKRLQEEALKSGRPGGGVKSQVSMADLLRLNPAGRNQNFNQSNLSLNSNNNRHDNIPLSQLRKEKSLMGLGNGGMPQQPLLGHQFQEGPTPYLMNGMSVNRFAPYTNGLQGVNMMTAMNGGGMGVPNPYGNGMNPGMNMPQYGMATQQYGMPMANMGFMDPPLDPQQRAKIDAWRQGIV